MTIEYLCAAIKSSLPFLKNARIGKTIDHSFVEKFQESIKDNLNADANDYNWEIEKTAKGRSERDSIDILGQPASTANPKWIIEIDATRSDQVSQKILSRLALWGLKEPIKYVAILYPDTQKGKSACEKYLRYGNEIIRKVNKESSIIGIFVDPSANTIEVLQFSGSNHFDVNGKECKSMTDAAAEAIKAYLMKHPVTYARLKQLWGKYVLEQRGPSRYKNINVKTLDGVTVHTFTQFRQYGICSYWTDFERLCKKNGIRVAKMSKLYVEGAPYYTYMV